jgi:hypothetical protein
MQKGSYLLHKVIHPALEIPAKDMIPDFDITTPLCDWPEPANPSATSVT